MKSAKVWFLCIASFSACALHAMLLQTELNHYVYTSIAKGILFLVCPLIYFRVAKERKYRDVFPMKGDYKNSKLSFVLGLCVFVLIWVFFLLLRPYLSGVMIENALADKGITDGNFLLVFLYIVLINAALEEIFFRGFVFMTLYRMKHKGFAYAYSSFLFAFYHVAVLWGWVSPVIFFLCIAGLAVAGLLFDNLALRSNSVTGSLIVHVSANLALNLIYILAL